MKIGITNNNCIEIIDLNDMSYGAIKQIAYYGFTRSLDGKSYFYNKSDYIEKTLELCKYLKQKNINCSYDNKVSEIINNKELKEKEFKLLKQSALDFKNGKYDAIEFNNFCNFVKTNIKRELKEHQIKAAYHHYLLKNGANFSVPGSGKTTTILTTFQKMKSENKVDKLFIVGPPASFMSWRDEYEFTLGIKPISTTLSGMKKDDRIDIYYGLNTNIDLFLISFQTFANDYKYIKELFIQNKIFFVIDEAHYIKQVSGKWSTAILNASKYSTVSSVLSGTPCPRSYVDLFNLFDLLWGKNEAITNKEKLQIQELEKNGNLFDAEQLVKRNYDALFYRVRKKDLGLLEPIFHEPFTIKMNPIERKIYDLIFNRIADSNINEYEYNVVVDIKKARIIRLRQATSYTKLLENATDKEHARIDISSISSDIINYNKNERPAKLELLIDLVKNIKKSDRKILIWSNFVGTIKLLENELSRQGYVVKSIHGEVPKLKTQNSEELIRDDIIKKFLDMRDDLDILIANPAACAESISLHKSCFNAIYYDLSYNCAQYLQSLDRIHRVGGSEKKYAHYYFLQYENTIESDILENLLIKRDKMYSVIENDADIYNLNIGNIYGDDAEIEAYDRIFNKTKK